MSHLGALEFGILPSPAPWYQTCLYQSWSHRSTERRYRGRKIHQLWQWRWRWLDWHQTCCGIQKLPPDSNFDFADNYNDYILPIILLSDWSISNPNAHRHIHRKKSNIFKKKCTVWNRHACCIYWLPVRNLYSFVLLTKAGTLQGSSLVCVFPSIQSISSRQGAKRGTKPLSIFIYFPHIFQSCFVICIKVGQLNLFTSAFMENTFTKWKFIRFS